MNILHGTYQSAYTMSSDGAITVVSDRINFTPSERRIIGVGDIDEDGLIMTLNLNPTGALIEGSWEERDSTDNAAFGGSVEFVADGPDRLVGQWTMPEGDKGTWVLIRSLGQTAAQH